MLSLNCPQCASYSCSFCSGDLDLPIFTNPLVPSLSPIFKMPSSKMNTNTQDQSGHVQLVGWVLEINSD